LPEQQCDDGRKPQWCVASVSALEKDGSPQALARARDDPRERVRSRVQEVV
jgi:hypothetical protein